MPIQRVTARFTPNIADGARLSARARQVVAFVHQEVDAIAGKMVSDLVATTPRSGPREVAPGVFEPEGTHIADGWTVRRVDDDIGEFGIEVYNADPRANEDRSAGSGTTTLLHILEYGSEDHTITAKDGGFLTFYWPAAKRWLKVQSVKHPGTEPYSMVTNATEGAVAKAQGLLRTAIEIMQGTR